MADVILGIFNSHPLKKFLDDHRGANGRDASVTSMGTEWKGSCQISDEEYPNFLNLYHDYLFVKNGRPLSLVEQPRLNEPKPLLIDLDFRYSAERGLARTFTMSHIQKFCEYVTTGLEHFFNLDQYEKVRFFVTLRPAPYDAKSVRKDGIHIECPDICLSNDKQKVLRNWLLRENAVGDAFHGTHYMNKPNDIYDESMTRKQGWIFYGETKPSIPRYELTTVICYDPETKEYSEQKPTAYSSRGLMEILSVRFNLEEDANVVREETAVEFKSLLRGEGVASPALRASIAPTTEIEAIPENPVLDVLREMMPVIQRSEEDTDIISSLVRDCLSPERADKYETWIRVGWCLHNISPTAEYFDLWMDFSKKSSKFHQNDVAGLRRDWFGRMRKDGDGPRLTELALRKWARDDNPVKYTEIIDANLLEYIRGCMDATHFHTARLMKKLYEGNYVASINQKTTEWFNYDDTLNMWKHINQGIQLRKNISFEVAGYISKSRDKLRCELARTMTEEVREVINAKIKKLCKIEECLYTTGFVDSTMKMAANFFYVEDFQNKLDSNVTLFGCRNGVLELRAKTADKPREHVIFRQGRPEDYVSFLAGQNLPQMEAISYVPFNQLNTEQRGHLAGLQDFFEKVFPDPALKKYTLRLLASCLEGANHEQCYYTLIGKGSNGKSKISDLCRFTFGDYWSSLQTTALTRKRPDAGNANPEIMAVKNKRFISMNEPDKGESINTSRMKQFSGEDMVEARGLFQDQEKFQITGKLFMLTNSLPPINTMDYGTWRRIRALPFPSTFPPDDDPRIKAHLKEGKALPPNVHRRDPEMGEKLIRWREVFLSWLVEIYDKEYLVEGLGDIPECVAATTTQYKQDFDMFAKFRAERMRDAEGEQSTFKQISTAFNKWIQDGNKRGGKLSPRELQERLNDELGEPEDGKTYNHVIVFNEEYDMEEWDQARQA